MRRISKPLLIGMALTLLLVLAVACGEDDSQEPTEIPATEATATVVGASATSTPPGTEGITGIPELDVVIEALRSGDAETLRPLIEYREVACNTDFEVGLTGCTADEEAGDLVEVFHFAVCEGQNLRPEFIDQALDVLAETELYAVYRAPDDEHFPAEYLAVVSSTSSDTDGVAWAVFIEDGRIFGLVFSCALPAEEFAERFQDAVLPPVLQ